MKNSISTITVLVSLFFITGCSGILPKGNPSPPLKRYALEYPAPSFGGLPRIKAALRVERFSIVRIFDSRMMLYRPAPYRYAPYHYFVWIAEPADMVTDFLVRDLQNSGLFTSVFSYDSPEQPRFVLEGGITEFFENDEGGARAVISVNATLLDTACREIDRKIVFQKGYAFSEPVEKNAESLAAGMSAAMRKLSAALITDLYSAVQERIKKQVMGNR